MEEHPAVVFTHFGSLKYGVNSAYFESVKDKYTAIYEPVLKSYCNCNHDRRRIGVVYIYVDEQVKKMLDILSQLQDDENLSIPVEIEVEEDAIKDLLRGIANDVRNRLPDPAAAPSFQFVGLRELQYLISELRKISPALPAYLSSPKFTFTYDSPKFVEAILRLARSETSYLADFPIIRLDEDTKCNPEFIDALMKVYLKERTKELYFFFSGTYGKPESVDLINDYAVRTHWFADPNLPVNNQLQGKENLVQTFLADLNELGATQIENSEQYYSSAMRRHLRSGSRSSARPRRSQTQVISGAGLIMSSRAIAALPPFMNFRFLTTWVDDHLKRRLHEAIGDIHFAKVESVPDARIQQDRHHNGIRTNDIELAYIDYFERLLRGCMFRAIIHKPSGEPTMYSNLVEEFVKDRRDRALTAAELGQVMDTISSLAQERLEEVLMSWKSDEFDGTKSYQWASELSGSDAQQKEYVKSVTQDAVNYLGLVRDWPFFVRAIRRLPYTGFRWLFEEVW